MNRVRVLVMGINHFDGIIYASIAAWNPTKLVKLHFYDLPQPVVNAVLEGTKVIYASVNLQAESELELKYYGWELE